MGAIDAKMQFHGELMVICEADGIIDCSHGPSQDQSDMR